MINKLKEKAFQILSGLTGSLLLKILPKNYIEKLRSKSIVWGFTHDHTFGDKIMMRLIGPYFWKNYYSASEENQRMMNRAHFWGSEAGKLWHEEIRKKYGSEELFRDEFLKRRENLTNMLQEFLNQFPGYYHSICEIGTGNGMYINYLCQLRLPGIQNWIGIDLNKEQITINQKLFCSSAIQFISVEALEWIDKNSEEGTIFLSVGTLEYFTQSELEEYFNFIKNKFEKAAIAIAEPVSFDLQKEFQSTPRGHTMFNHNYPYMLSNAGYQIYKAKNEFSNPEEGGNGSQLVSLIAIIN